MSLFLASVVVLLSLASAYTYPPRTECYFDNQYINSASASPPPSDKCLVSRETLLRVLRWVLSLISQLQEAGQIEREEEARNMEINQSSSFPKSFSFFPIFYRNNWPCN